MAYLTYLVALPLASNNGCFLITRLKQIVYIFVERLRAYTVGSGAEPIGRGSGGQSPPEAGDFLQIRFILSLFKDTNLVKIYLCGFYQIMNSSVRNYLIDIDQENCKYFAINMT